MKYAILFLLLAACGAAGATAPTVTPTAPAFDAVPLAFDNEPWTSHDGSFGCRVAFAGGPAPSYVGWAAHDGEALTEIDLSPVTFWDSWDGTHGFFQTEYLSDPADAPPDGWLYVEAVVAGWKYAALIFYAPGFSDGWTITRNDLWMP